MSRFVRDEKRTYPFAWLILGGVFAAVSVWAMYDEMTRRVVWQEHQQRFFDLELELARQDKVRAEKEWAEASRKEPLKTTLARVAELEKQITDPQSPYGKAKAKLAELDQKFADTELLKTFGGSDLDEAYYYRNLAEYARDAAAVKVRELYKQSYGAGDPKHGDPKRAAEPAAIYADPAPAPPEKGAGVEMYRVQVQLARMKAWDKQIDQAITGGHPAALVAALKESKKMTLEVAAMLALEIKHQGRIDAALRGMAAIDGPDDPHLGETDPGKRAAAQSAARKAACAGKEETTRHCLSWLVLGPVDDELKTLRIGLSKAKRDLGDAELRLAKAEDKARPKFKLDNPLEYLVGPFQIEQVVNHWMDFTRDVDIEVVDRCQTCHMGVQSGDYQAASIPREFRTHPRRAQLLGTHSVDKFGCTACHQGQGRATDDLAHSAWSLHEKWGVERWHYDGDHYWEDPMLPVGKLEQIVIDEHNDELEVKIGRGKKVKIALDHGIKRTDTELYGELQSKLQQVLDQEKELAGHWRAVARKLDNRVELGLVLKDPTTVVDGKAVKAPKDLVIGFPEVGTARLLGFVLPRDGERVLKLEQGTLLTAPNPPSYPVRADNPAAQGKLHDSAGDYAFVPPAGEQGLQIPDRQRNRFIQALPEIESGCLRCHAQDSELTPRRSKSSHVAAKLAFEKAQAEHDKDPAGYVKARGSAKLPSVPEAPGESRSLAPTLDEGRRLFRGLNCTGCHLLEGFENNKDQGPALDDISAKVEPGWLLGWLRYPRGWRAKTSMPNLWPAPLDPASKVPYPKGSPEHDKWQEERAEETLSVAAFLYERSENPEQIAGRSTGKGAAGQRPLREKIKGYAEVEGADAKRGKLLFASYGCQGCHANTEGADLPRAWRDRERDVAPTLANLGNKTSADWIAYWVEDPSRYWHGTAMPNLRLSRVDAASIAKYLASLKAEAPRPADVSKAEVALVLDAKRRHEQVECALAGKKLSRVDCGQKVIEKRGCYGCHRIGGFEGKAPIGPELTGFAKKDTSTLDYGYAIADHHLQTTETFATLKLDSPRIFARDRIQLFMGDFDLSAKEIRALVVFLKGTVPVAPSEKFDPMKDPSYVAAVKGRQLVDDLNCRGCHVIEGYGADIDGFRLSHLSRDPQLRAPFLDGEGARAQPEWLFNFLRQPGDEGIRPWLHPEWVWGAEVPDDKLALRMPTFNLSADQWTLVVRYFSAWDNQAYPYEVPKVAELDKDERLYALANMSSTQTGNCLSCHYYGEFPVERAKGDIFKMAPNIASMQKRLRPEWVKQWLLRPHNYLPYTKMTAFFASVDRPKTAARWPKENDPFLSPAAMGWDKTVPGAESRWRAVTSEEQATLLRDFIFQIPTTVPWPAPGEEAHSPMVDPDAAPVSDETAEKEEDGDAKEKGKDKKKAKKTGAVRAPRGAM